MNGIRLSRQKHGAIYILCVTLLMAALGYLLFARLGEMYITDYDEARHGVNAYEMIRNDDYLVTTYQGEPDYWNLKPPLSFWLIALSYRLFGYNAFALRFFSAFSGLLAAAAVAAWCAKRFGRWAAPLALVFFTANSLLFGLHFVRFGDADAQYQLFFTLAALSALMCDRDIRWIYLSGLFFGLAFLEKGLHAANIPIVCFLILLFTGQLKKLTWKRIAVLIVAGSLFIAPWAAARFARDGFQFIGKMFSTDVAARVGSVADPADASVPALQYYINAVFQSPTMLICLGLCLVSLGLLTIHRRALSVPQRNAVIGCTVWLIVPILTYSLANVKYCWYVYSSLMALPALTAALVCSTVSQVGVAKVRAGVLCAALSACVFFTGQNVSAVSSIVFHHTIQGFLKEDLNRDLDTGVHAYIQYNEGNRTDWMPGAVLTALFYGDTICLNGGADAYLADDSSAILYVCKENNQAVVNQLQQQEAVRNEDYYVIAFEK
jgi:4-amino-4-deoxy-L-arabinose transferase-like glycosyltransferase